MAGLSPEPRLLREREREALDGVKRLTGYEAETCPEAAVYRADVQRACRAKHYRFAPVIEPDPPTCLVDAALAVSFGEAERSDYERDHPQRDVVDVVQTMGSLATSPDQLPRRRR